MLEEFRVSRRAKEICQCRSLYFILSGFSLLLILYIYYFQSVKSENITKKMLKKIRNHQDGRKSGGQLHVRLNAKRIEENLKKKKYHTLMTTQRRHRFFFFFTKCTSTDKCLKPSPFETFRNTVVRRCEGTFNLSFSGT